MSHFSVAVFSQTPGDVEALLALADELEGEGLDGWANGPLNVGEYARRIREALGVVA